MISPGAMRRAIGPLLLGLLAAQPPAFAQGPTTDAGPDRMRAFLDGDLHRGLVRRALGGLPSDVLPRCPALHGGPDQVVTLKPLSFAADGIPDGGVWQENFSATGCGNDTTLHIIFIANADEKINTIVELPGGTLADPILQKDAVLIANAEAALLIGGCTAFNVINTAQAGEPPVTGKPWAELWTLAGCGQTTRVVMHFTPDATGTKITTSLP